MFRPKPLSRPWDPKRPFMRPMQERHSDPIYHTAHWTRESKVFRQANPLCKECEKEGIIEAAEVTDHIIPLDICGDPWNKKNWQGLCRRHNNKKAAQDKKLILKHRKKQDR
jgi:5-methylcytosine-specific restriction endonuclease McrA